MAYPQTELQIQESEYEKLKKEIDLLRQVIANLTAEYDDLKNHICREIQADYDEKVGNLEHRATECKMEVLRLRRLIELMQAEVNRREKPSYEKAKEKTDEEYRQYQEDLHQKAEEMKDTASYARRRREQDEKNRKNAAEETKKSQEESQEKQTEEKTQEKEAQKRIGEKNATEEAEEEPKEKETPEEELKRLYRKIVKRLHPDMNPDVTEEELELFREAAKAYSEGNLEKLRDITATLDSNNMDEIDDSEEGIERLRQMRDTLMAKKDDLLYLINWQKTHFPYIAKDFLADEDAVTARQMELKEYIAETEHIIEELNERITELQKKGEAA